MQPRHRTALVAPLLLLACTLEINGSDATTDLSTTSTSEMETSSPTTPTSVPTTLQPTTSEATTEDPTSGTTADTDATAGDTESDTESDTTTDTGEETPCMMSGECMEGQVCWAPYTDKMGDFSCQDTCVGDAGKGNSAMVWCADDAACCTADASCNNMGYCIPGQDPPDTDTDTDTDSSSGSDTGADTGSTGDTGFVVLPEITITGLTVTANCMPQVPTDPVTAQWTAVFDNTTDVDITATVTGANLTYNPGPDEFVQDISVDPTSSGLVMPSETVMKAMTKTKALNDLPMDCSQCDNMVNLEVLFNVGGEPIVVLAEATLKCSF